MTKTIVCGEIAEEMFGTPIEIFKEAVKYAKKDEFYIETNNPQFIEAVEVLCGEDNIEFYIYIEGQYCKQDRAMDIYNYLGDVYDIINSLRFAIDIGKDFGDTITDDDIEKEINEYELKYRYHAEEECKLDESQFEHYEEVLREPKCIEAYQTDKPVVIRNCFNKKRVAEAGDWVIRYPDGNLDVSSSLTQYRKIEEGKDD